MKTHCRKGHDITAPGSTRIYTHRGKTKNICRQCVAASRDKATEDREERALPYQAQPFEQLRDPWEAEIFGGAQV